MIITKLKIKRNDIDSDDELVVSLTKIIKELQIVFGFSFITAGPEEPGNQATLNIF